MAKRAPAGETAYDPLDHTLAQSVIKPAEFSPEAEEFAGGNMVRMPRQTFRQPDTVSKAATYAVPEHRSPSTAHTPQGVRGLTKAKRVLLTPEEERQIERLVDRIAEHVGASLKLSHVLRACMALLCHAEAELLRHASGHPLVRPANGDAVALAQFEQGIARILSLALRDAPPIR